MPPSDGLPSSTAVPSSTARGGLVRSPAVDDVTTLTASELQLIHAFRSRPRARHVTSTVIDFSQKLSPVASYISYQMAMTMSQVTRTTWFVSRYWWLRHSRRRYGPVVASLAIGGCAMKRRMELGGSDDVPLSSGHERRTGLHAFLRLAGSLTTPDPLPEFTGSMILFIAAFAPHKALIRRFLKVAAKVCKIPRIRKTLQKNGKKLAKLLAQNKAKNEVFSYRQALNEAWKELESSLAPDVLQSMRAAERRAAAIAHGAFEEDDADALFFSKEKEESDDDDNNNNKKNNSNGVNNNSTNTKMKSNIGFGPKLPERKKEKQRRHKRKPSTLQRVGSLMNVVTGGSGENNKGNDNNDDEEEREDENDENASKAVVTFDAPQTPKSPRAPRNRWFDTPSDVEEEDIDEDIDGIIRDRNAKSDARKNSKNKHVVTNNALERNGILSNIQRSVLHFVEDVRCFPQDAVDYVFLGDGGLPLAKLPRESDIQRLIRAIETDAKDCFTYVQLACFLMQRQNKIDIAAEAVERSAKWRSGYKFLDDGALRKFENVIFRHRRLARGGAQVIFRLRAAHDMILKKSSLDSSLNLEMVVCAIVSVVEREWQKLRASGNGRLRGGIVCVVDCAGLDITALPISLVAATLRLLDANYPELAAEVHVTSVWWAAKRALKALLDGVSTSSRARVHIYKSGDSGTEKLLDHFARHQLPSCIAGGTCKCRRCKSLPTAQMVRTREGTWRDIPWREMNASQRRQYVRHHFVYLVGLCAFYPMHFARMTAHPFLVSAVKLDSRMSRRTRIMVWRTVMSAIILLVTFWIWQWMESNPTQVEIIRSTLREKSKAKIDNLQRKAVLARDRFKSSK